MNYQKIPFNEYIFVDSYEKLVKEINHPNLLYVPLEAIEPAFKLIQSRPNEKFIVVSACSDYGLEYQSQNPINKDLRKINQFIQWDKIEGHEQYVHLNIPAAIYDKCRIEDKISVKIYGFTCFTFNEKPPNLIKWFCTNSNVDEDGVAWIPFGVNNDGPGSSLIEQNFGSSKKHVLYVNLQNTTIQRATLKDWYKNQNVDWPMNTLVYRDKPNLPVLQYLQELSASEFVLSPRGNGLDCYRVLECIYAGSVPVMEESRFSLKYIEVGLPVLLANNLFALTLQRLGEAKARFGESKFNYDTVKLSYWKNILENSVKELD